VQPHADRRSSHVFACVGFWLWALVGAGVVFSFISFIGWFFLVPAAVVAYRLAGRSRWNDGPVLLGAVAGAGLPLLLVAGLQWDNWQHRIAGDNTPNPFYWGGVGLCLLVTGTIAYALRSRRS
jgi:hypothetical protein